VQRTYISVPKSPSGYGFAGIELRSPPYAMVVLLVHAIYVNFWLSYLWLSDFFGTSQNRARLGLLISRRATSCRMALIF